MRGLNQLIAALGLILLAPIGLQLVQGTLTFRDAAIRAAALFAGVVVARKMPAATVSTTPTLVAAAETDEDLVPVDATVRTRQDRDDHEER